MPLLLRSPDAARDPDAIEIGLLNNYSDAGLPKGERQIIDLLEEVAGPRKLHLRLFAMPSIPRGAAARAHMERYYGDVRALMRSRIDGLIVTGCEPRRERLPDETFWPDITAVIDWAEHNTRSTIWSCLAAHAAVLHLDGVERQRLPQKCTGLFRVRAACDDPLLSGAPSELRVPHSRWNGLAASDLKAAGYRILTGSDAVGVDTFTKAWRSLFVYLQGHPEYDAGAIGREYRRDVGRYLDGVDTTYPTLPVDYFDAATAAALGNFEAEARARRDPRMAAALPLGVVTERRGRCRLAATLFGNWLGFLRATTSGHAA